MQIVHPRRLVIGTNAEKTALDASGYAVGSVFFETDTNDSFMWNGTSWQTLGGEAGAGFNDAEGDPANVSSVLSDGISTYAARRDHVHTIASDVVTNAHLVNMSEATVKGRATGAGSGDPVDLTASQLIDLLETADGSGSGLDADTLDGLDSTAFSQTTHNHFSDAEGDPANVTSAAADGTSSFAARRDHAHTIGNDVVTNVHLANMAQSTIKGRAVGAGTGDPTDLTAAQATAILNLFTSTLQGLAPASGGGTTNFLRADGTWAVPAGGSGITSLNGQTGATQTFATGTAGTDFGISSAANVHTFDIPSASNTARGLITTGTQNIAGQKTFTTNPTLIGDGTGGRTIAIDGAAGNTRNVAFRTGGLNRWIWEVSATAEGGSDAGSDLLLRRRNDAGNAIDIALSFIRSSGDIYSDAWTNYFSSSTIVGWTSFTISDIRYKRIGKLVWVVVHLSGTSNSTNCTFTLPYSASSDMTSGSSVMVRVMHFGTDGGATIQGWMTLLRGSNQVAVSNVITSTASTGWSSSGTKQISAQFFYEAA